MMAVDRSDQAAQNRQNAVKELVQLSEADLFGNGEPSIPIYNIRHTQRGARGDLYCGEFGICRPIVTQGSIVLAQGPKVFTPGGEGGGGGGGDLGAEEGMVPEPPIAAEPGGNAADGATTGMGGRVLSSAEQAEFETFAARAKSAGLQENPYRTGSWGNFDANGKFKEAARIDVARPGASGWEGQTHMHVQPNLKAHLPLTTKIPGEQ